MILAAFLAAASAAAQSFSPPVVGVMATQKGELRPIYGLAGNLIVGGALRDDVRTFAFSGRYGLAKTANQVLLLDSKAALLASFEAPEGDALFAFGEDGKPSLCYFPQSRELCRIGDDGFCTEPLPTDQYGDEIIALQDMSHDMAKLIVRREAVLVQETISLQNGEILAQENLDIPPDTPIAAVRGGILFSTGEVVVLLRDNGSREHFPISGVVRSFQPIGKGWMKVDLVDEIVALKMTGAGEVYFLPDEAIQ
jgi:hypothetical protein